MANHHEVNEIISPPWSICVPNLPKTEQARDLRALKKVTTDLQASGYSPEHAVETAQKLIMPDLESSLRED